MTIKNIFQSKNDKAEDVVVCMSELQTFKNAKDVLAKRIFDFLSIQNQSYNELTGNNMTSNELYQTLEEDEGINFIAKTIHLTENDLREHMKAMTIEQPLTREVN